ncbi:hypothetical protein [Azospirillum sp. TSO35-2]|uniref:hypothetical protein n=1 Tax=Azospirillum sp. TSO35-2 TaxID=716796 RepID=UPI000D65DE13|nr:hypothetical protein [Azospirillum sp. TSO35-2]
MSTPRNAILTALLLAATGIAVSGCVAYDPYYPAYGESVVVPPPTVYAAPPVVVQPGYGYGYYYRRPWRGDGGWHGDRGWHGHHDHHHGGRGWR